MKKFLIVAILLIILPLVSAEKQIKLLAVSETADGYVGTSADLYLDIKPGTNHIFMDTFPFTKLDTQMSTRFAKSVACDYLEEPCEKYDFFYRMRANSPIVGGPSGGGALAVITIAALKGLELDENTAITGTINSGGLIGTVGGLKEKIKAAANIGMTKVLIPNGGRFHNKTFDLVLYGKELGVSVIEVSNLNEVLFEFTGQTIIEENAILEISEEYTQLMKNIAVDLCNRSKILQTEADHILDYKSIKESGVNLTKRSQKAFENKDYYSAASFCFGSNIRFSNLLLLEKNQSKEEIKVEVEQILKKVKELEIKYDAKSMSTITDLETYMIVKERLIETKDYLNKTIEGDSQYNLAFAKERLQSAITWAKFFGAKGEIVNIDKETLRNSCFNKIAEAEERYQYVGIFLPSQLAATRTQIQRAEFDQKNGDYALCLFKAAKAKAESSSVLTAVNLHDNVNEIISQKLQVIKRNIASQNSFPILGYSYYEYARVLNESDPFSALLYAEYALELSNLDIYFKDPIYINKEPAKKMTIDKRIIYILIYGAIIGYVLSLIFRKEKR